jgi:prolyl oligopeptidase
MTYLSHAPKWLTIVAVFMHAVAMAEDAPPRARATPTEDRYFGMTVPDPYRWMEKNKDELQGWLTAQDRHARRLLDRLPGRPGLLQSLQKFDASTDRVGSAMRCANHWLFLKTPADGDIAKLLVRDSTGRERTLVDPAKFDDGSKRAKIDYWVPSWDCTLVAYGVSLAGAEVGTLRIVTVATGIDLSDTIERVYYGDPAWLPDNSGFFHARLAPNAPPDEITPQIVLHKLGADPARDVPIVGANVSSTVRVPAYGYPTILTAPDSPYALLLVELGFSDSDNLLYAARLDGIAGPRTPWKPIATKRDHVRSGTLRGTDVIMTVGEPDSPTRKIVVTPVEPSNVALTQTLVAASSATITDIRVGADALYVLKVEGGPVRLTRVPWQTRREEEIATAPFTNIRDLTALASIPGAVMIAESWVRSPVVLQYGDSRLIDSELQSPVPIDFSDIVVSEVRVTLDGVGVPLTILHKQGIALDGSHPTLLYGYGAYGDSNSPKFDRMRRAWFDRGGIYAVAHVRGGGEFGESWHKAGKLGNKLNTITDFIRCAEYLVERGYTSPRLLAGSGRSAGGIMIGGAIVWRPDLFGAALVNVGMVNAVRFEQIPIGPFNTVEFGSVSDRAGFKMLLAIDAYHRVTNGTRYPAVLLSTGLTDARVSPWQTAKLAARLQVATSSGNPVLLRLDAGHSGDGTQSLARETKADELSFLLWRAGHPEFQPPSGR